MGRSVVFALAVAVAVASVRCATSEMAGTFAFTMDKVLDWQWKSEMQMQIRASDQDPVPLTYTVIPLTTNLGLNESQLVRGQVDIRGKVVAADATNYPSITGSDVIPYLCCDETEQTNASNLTPTAVLNALMDNNPQPAAILLYSQQGMCCGLNGNNLNFNRILTMSDNEAASETLRMANMSEGTAQAQISGNFTETEQSNDAGQQGGNNSAVAMSILYSITGLITLLFLIIIATGAIRAHRYPERYGPRNAFGGRPRQSRAKGLARAVLETLPIVKFGDSQPKPDPNLELENGSSQQTGGSNADRQPPENGSDRHLSTIPESPLGSPAQPAASGALGPGSDSDADAPGTSRVTQHGTDNTASGTQVEEALGCSICTEDFTVGEDVRVLPCNHKFHPPCVDPWLVNVSGTCPLCRLDLRPEQGEGGDDEHNENTEAPPLGADANDNADSSNSSRRRSRLFDLHRLRHATVEERIEVLRRYRTEQRSGSSASNEEEGRDRSRLTNRLRDRFRVRTRAVQRSSERTGSSPLTATEAANQS